MANGKYIVVEGISGVGKSVIIERLARELQAAQIPVQIIMDSRHSSDLTAQAIQRIIDDPRYPMGSRAEVLLYNAVHSQSLEDIRRAVSAGTVCIADHSYLTTLVTEYYGRGDVTDYTAASQIVHYATEHMQPDLLLLLDAPVSAVKGRLDTKRQAGFDEAYQERVRAGYLWEAKQRNVPIVYATDPIDTVLTAAWKLVGEIVGVKSKGTPAGTTNVQSVAEVLAANPPSKTAPVEPPITATGQAAPDSSAKSYDDTSINSDPGVKTMSDPPSVSAVNRQSLANTHDDVSLAVAEAGQTELGSYVTNTKGPVYGFTDTAPSIAVLAAFARSSHNGSDIRVNTLEEIKSSSSQKDPHLQTASGTFDERDVAQYKEHYFVLENVSHILAATLEQERSATYIELAGHSADFTQKDANGHYRYIIPGDLKGKPRSSYIRTMNQIFDMYTKLVVSVTAHLRATSTVPGKKQNDVWRSATRAQACRIVRPVLPAAAATTIAVHASDHVLESLCVQLLSSNLPEARSTGRRFRDELYKIAGSLFADRVSNLNLDEATDYYADTYASVHGLSSSLLPANYTAETRPVTLADYTPRNELDLVANILYEHSDLPLQAVQQVVTSWPYQRKLDVLTTYIGERLSPRHIPGPAFDKARYGFDLVSDFDNFRDLQRSQLAEDVERQAVSPRLGYDVPELIDTAGVTEAFEQCFDLSLQLYSELQSAGFALEAQYATLLGHKLRWKATYNARAAFRMLEQPIKPQDNPGCHELIRQMHAQIAEVHPVLAGAMRFAGTNELPEAYSLTANSEPGKSDTA